MENRSHAIAAGIFALILGSAMVMAFWWFADDREATREYVLVSRGNIGSLNVQATVRFRGMAAGKVTAINLDPDDPRNILVTISIREDLPLTMGTMAMLDSQGVTGIAFIQLDDFGEDLRPLVGEPGRPPRLLLEPSIFTRITEATLAAMQGLESMARHLGSLMTEENRERYGEMLARLESIATGIDQALAGMPATLAAVQDLASPENLAHITTLLAHFEQAGAEAVPAVQELRELLASLAVMSTRLETTVDQVGGELVRAGDQLVEGTLPHVDGLLRELAASSRRLGRLLEEIEAEPQVLLRGRAQPEPGPGEAGFQ